MFSVLCRWFIRWDAPSESDVTIVNIFIQTDSDINVFVSDNRNTGFVNIPKLTRYPTLSDPAGAHCRDPQVCIVLYFVCYGVSFVMHVYFRIQIYVFLQNIYPRGFNSTPLQYHSDIHL